LYLFLTAYPLVFQGVHGMNLGVGGLPFFGMITGTKPPVQSICCRSKS
jgi:DHA1 family multidrug resistance protein-like MFS transporter